MKLVQLNNGPVVEFCLADNEASIVVRWEREARRATLVVGNGFEVNISDFEAARIVSLAGANFFGTIGKAA